MVTTVERFQEAVAEGKHCLCPVLKKNCPPERLADNLSMTARG